MASRILHISILLHTLLFSLPQGYIMQRGHCEPIRIPMCQSMAWNSTEMPNLMDQTSQQNAMLKIEEYSPLVRYNCSTKLPFFLCSIFAPICMARVNPWATSDVPKVKPCREVCQQVRDECEPVIISRYNRTWPEEINCDNFPRYNEGVCISPEAIQSQTINTTSTAAPQNTRKNKKDRDNSESCDCKKKTRLHMRRYLKAKLQMVLRVKVINSNHIGRMYLTGTTVIKILKNQAVNLELEEGDSLMFWTKRKACREQQCPDVRENKEYILACNKMPNKDGRLIFDPEVCMISRWKDEWTQTIADWERVANLPKSSRRDELRRIRHAKKNKKKTRREGKTTP